MSSGIGTTEKEAWWGGWPPEVMKRPVKTKPVTFLEVSSRRRLEKLWQTEKLCAEYDYRPRRVWRPCPWPTEARSELYI